MASNDDQGANSGIQEGAIDVRAGRYAMALDLTLRQLPTIGKHKALKKRADYQYLVLGRKGYYASLDQRCP